MTATDHDLFPGCMTQADTFSKLEKIQDAMRAWDIRTYVL